MSFVGRGGCDALRATLPILVGDLQSLIESSALLEPDGDGFAPVEGSLEPACRASAMERISVIKGVENSLGERATDIPGWLRDVIDGTRSL